MILIINKLIGVYFQNKTGLTIHVLCSILWLPRTLKDSSILFYKNTTVLFKLNLGFIWIKIKVLRFLKTTFFVNFICLFTFLIPISMTRFVFWQAKLLTVCLYFTSSKRVKPKTCECHLTYGIGVPVALVILQKVH